MSIVEQLETQIAELRLKISTIQSECSHPMSARVSLPGASTGNYDPSNDGYWVDHECLLCQKAWREDLESGR